MYCNTCVIYLSCRYSTLWLYDIDIWYVTVCHQKNAVMHIYIKFTHNLHTIYHKSAWILWYSTPNQHQLMLNLCTAASCAARPALAKCQATTRCDCKVQVASGIIAGFSTELCDFTTEIFHGKIRCCPPEERIRRWNKPKKVIHRNHKSTLTFKLLFGSSIHFILLRKV